MIEQRDAGLVAAARAGDKDAFGQLVERYQQMIKRVALEETFYSFPLLPWITTFYNLRFAATRVSMQRRGARGLAISQQIPGFSEASSSLSLLLPG
jgi:hypothetical protein